jgi:DNA (cytosine-5)-methyltransferase 1
MRIGGLFFGYGGLDLAVQSVFPDAELAWYSEFDKGANKIAAHRFPNVPNHGDITAIDWSQVEPVDILTGGSPCQDLSNAGARKGMTEGTRSNLWVAMREAIAQLRPSLVVWENVRGAYSAAADSEVEPCAGCVGDGSGVFLRALGRVLGDLSDLGYDTRWHGLRAADVGAPHGRFRVFVVAYPAGDAGRIEHGDGSAAALANGGGWFRGGSLQLGGTPGHASGHGAVVADADDNGRRVQLSGRPGEEVPRAAGALLPTPAAYDGERGGPQHPDKRRDGGHSVSLQDAVHGMALLPTPRAGDGEKGGPNQRGSSGDYMLPSAVTHLLPTPAVNDMGEGKTVEAWDEWTAKMKAAHGNGNGHGASLAIEAQRLLPTPTSNDRATSNREKTEFQSLTKTATSAATTWGQYADAIARWEALTRPAPAPTMQSKKGTPQLAPQFSEWMMGLPAGWVTDVPGITRNEALKALGNGVVWQQAAAALRLMLGANEVAA